MEYTGTLFSLFSPFTLLAGVTAVAFFLYHGAVMLELKLPNEIKGVREVASKAGLVTIILFMLMSVSSVFETNVFGKPVSTVFAVITFLALLASYFMNKKDSRLMALVMNALTIVCTVITLFTAMFPNVMVSNTDAAYNLDIYNIASGSYTLTVITVVTVTLLPIVIGYTAWTYYVFSIKTAEDKDIEY
jgi:cytochrome d ubiquinol oxidase subunit II